MPEVAVHEDGHARSTEHDIGSPVDALRRDSIPKAASEQGLPEGKLRRRVPATDGRHDLRGDGWVAGPSTRTHALWSSALRRSTRTGIANPLRVQPDDARNVKSARESLRLLPERV
jgi:hypothetical protein